MVAGLTGDDAGDLSLRQADRLADLFHGDVLVDGRLERVSAFLVALFSAFGPPLVGLGDFGEDVGGVWGLGFAWWVHVVSFLAVSWWLLVAHLSRVFRLAHRRPRHYPALSSIPLVLAAAPRPPPPAA